MLTLKEINRKKKYPDTDTFKWYNANPKHNITGDCVIRAISKATNKDWYETLDNLCNIGKELGDVPNCDIAYETYLNNEGFTKMKQPKKASGKKYTANEFAKNHKKGSYVLRLANHLTVCVDGILYDIWNCGYKTVGNYWVKTK